MQEGAFALVDCLGFKGIWKRADPELLIQKLLKIEEAVNEHLVSDVLPLRYLSFGPIRAHIRLLSDTVAISLQYEEQAGKEPEPWQTNVLVCLICHSIIKILNLFLEGDPPLVLRGCVTYGEHLSNGNFIVGPAVDDAAEHMNIPEGAFVWVHPTAASRLRIFQARMIALTTIGQPEHWASAIQKMRDPEGKFDWARKKIEEHGAEDFGTTLLELIRPFVMAPIVVDPYLMPIKGGAHLSCPIVNPLAFRRTVEERESIVAMYSRIIEGNRLDLWLKHQNTMSFLAECEHLSASFEDSIAHLRKGDSENEGDGE